MTDIPAIVSNVVSKVTDAQVMGDLDAAVAFAKASGKADVSKLGITGFCWGGRIVWMYAAHNPALKAGVAWYGPLLRGYAQGDKGVLDVADKIKAPMLGLYGGADGGIPNDSVDKMRAALKAAGNTKSEIVTYPDTPHAFFADYRPSYRREQADDGWKRALAWFKQNLG
jgi:carboxymethylenebutenolidase